MKRKDMIKEISYMLTTQRKNGLSDHRIAMKIVDEIFGKEMAEFATASLEKLRELLFEKVINM